jgi:signal transduction histidine kinase
MGFILHLVTLERLLMLAKTDSSVLPIKLQSFSTGDFMGQFAEDAQLLAESRGLRLRLAQNDSGVAVFDQGWMRQALFNLLSNALRFSPLQGTITYYSKRTMSDRYPKPTKMALIRCGTAY